MQEFDVLCSQLQLIKFHSHYLGFGYGVARGLILVSLVEKLRNILLWATQKAAVSWDHAQASIFITRCLVILSHCQEIKDPGGL